MATRKTKKPTPRKKKKVNEADFEVTVKDTAHGTKTPETKTKVSAANADQALDVATKGQQTTGSEEVTVKKADTSAGVHGGKSMGGVLSETKIGSVKAITEAAEYPYSVSLPKQFRKFLEASDLDHVVVGSTVVVRFDNKTQLGEAITGFKKSKAPEAMVVLNGISRSVL